MATPVSESTAVSHAELLARIRSGGAVPKHVAIIMDGNGRWARARYAAPVGHRGHESRARGGRGRLQAGVEWLSLFAFSQENWQRPAARVKALMSLLEEYIARESGRVARAQGVRAHAGRS